MFTFLSIVRKGFIPQYMENEEFSPPITLRKRQFPVEIRKFRFLLSTTAEEKNGYFLGQK